MLILFDLDRTLLDHDGAVRAAADRFHREFADRFGHMTPEAFHARWCELVDLYAPASFAGRVPWAEQRRRRTKHLFADIGERLDDAAADGAFARYLAHFEANWRAFDDVPPCLDALADYPLGIISNGELAQQLDKLDAVGIRGRFDPIVISGAAGLAKPDPRIFAHACREAGRSPDDCLYVGDKLEDDARAARLAGLWGVWLDRGGPSDPFVRDVSVILSLSELPGLVRLYERGRRDNR